jgi:hypothetical protein
LLEKEEGEKKGQWQLRDVPFIEAGRGAGEGGGGWHGGRAGGAPRREQEWGGRLTVGPRPQ